MSNGRILGLLCVLVLVGCAEGADPVGLDPEEQAMGEDGRADSASVALPDIRCAGLPATGGRGSWRHRFKSPLITALGSPNHRGIDLIAGSTTAVQAIRGEISYGVTDKALEDETVEIFACRASRWVALGSAITDGEGRFELDLSGANRLPIGVRTMYVSVVGDRTGADFVAMVAPAGSSLVASDVDGTLTSSENAFPLSLVTHANVAAQPSAAAALNALRGHHYYPVYVTSRGRIFTEATRRWLEAQGFPRGPLRLAEAPVTLPGSATVAYKLETLQEIESNGIWVMIGIGNRASDAEAYGDDYISGDWIFLKNPEFASENAPVIANGGAVGVNDYAELVPRFAALADAD